MLVTGREPPVDLAALARIVQLHQAVEPIDMVAVGVEHGDGSTPTLAELPFDVPDDPPPRLPARSLRTSPADGNGGHRNRILPTVLESGAQLSMSWWPRTIAPISG